MKTLWIFGIVISIDLLMLALGPSRPLDARFYYDAEEASRYLASLTPEQWAAYIRFNLLDFALIPSYTALLWRIARKELQLGDLRWIALAPAALDLVESSTIFAMLHRMISPDPPQWLGALTAMKWLSGAIVVVVFLKRWKRMRRA